MDLSHFLLLYIVSLLFAFHLLFALLLTVLFLICLCYRDQLIYFTNPYYLARDNLIKGKDLLFFVQRECHRDNLIPIHLPNNT